MPPLIDIKGFFFHGFFNIFWFLILSRIFICPTPASQTILDWIHWPLPDGLNSEPHDFLSGESESCLVFFEDVDPKKCEEGTKVWWHFDVSGCNCVTVFPHGCILRCQKVQNLWTCSSRLSGGAKIAISALRCGMIWVCFRIKDPKNRLSNRQAYRKNQIKVHWTPFAGWISTQSKTNGSALNPSRHSSLGQACEGLTVIGQDSKRMPNVGSCEVMSRHLPGCLGGTPQHATLCTTRCVSCLVELVLRIMSGDWLQGFRLESHALLPMLCNLSPHTGSWNNPHHPYRPDDWHGP